LRVSDANHGTAGAQALLHLFSVDACILLAALVQFNG